MSIRFNKLQHNAHILLNVSNIQNVPGGMDKTSESVPYVELDRYNLKHLYPKLNGYGDNGQRSLKL